MRLSVIVPVHDGREYLARCLSALTSSTRRPDELIVVDDGSNDDSASVARAHGATVLAAATGPRGPAWARNHGAAKATGDVLVFVDADVVVHPDALARMTSTLERRSDVHALFGSYDTSPPAPGVASRYKNLHHHYVHQHGKREACSFWAGCGAVRREAFLAIGGFDEAMPSIEDIDFGVRLVRSGLSIRLCPEIQATHLKHWTLTSLWRADIFARAVPWTRLVLREGHLPNDLNLGWRSRIAALCACAATAFWGSGVLALALRRPAFAGPAALGALSCLALSTRLDADLYRFFFRHGGMRFAVGAWALHHAYLLYGSAVFASLSLAHGARLGRENKRKRSRP